MNIDQIMSKNLIVVDIDTKLEEVAKIMQEKDIGFLPVSENKKIIGVITDRDIVTKIIANKDNKIKGYINQNIICLDINDSIEEALNIMGSKKVKRLLIKNNNKLVGILSISDFMNINEQFIETIKKIWQINRNNDEYPTKITEFEL